MHQHLYETQFESVIALTQAGARPLQDLSRACQNHGNQKASPEEPAMEGTSNADPVSSNNFCSRKRRTVICVN